MKKREIELRINGLKNKINKRNEIINYKIYKDEIRLPLK